MKNLKVILGFGVLAIASFFVIAADHIDAPAVKGGTVILPIFMLSKGKTATT